MKVALVFPPQGHFTQPYLSLPSLSAYLRQHGVAEVTQIDASIEAYDHFLSRDRLALSLERVLSGAGLAALEAKGALGFSDMERYQLLSEIDVVGESVVEGIEEAKRVLRSPEAFYDYDRYLWAGRTLEQGLRIFSAEFAPTRLTAHGFVMRARIERSREIVEALSNEAENPFLSYFREHTVPRIQALDPDLLGLSVTFPAQAIPALTLAKLLKEWKPELHITMGGGLLAYVAEKLSKQPAVWDLVDSMVLLEGERPLLELCETVAGDGDLSRVSNLVYRDRDSGEVVPTKQREPLDIKTLPTPDFDGMPLDLYFSPELVLPLAMTRGCYWGKCVFCTLYTVIGPGYRGRTVEQSVEDLAELSRKYGTNKFYMAIEDLPPNMAKRLPRAILDAGLDIEWWADARLEHDVFDQQVCDDLAAAGCRRLAFGYESASQRVLDRMCKGIDPVKSMDLVRRVRKAGISVTLYVMVGFPTETREEADATLAAILEHQDQIQEVSVRVFYLDESSEIFKRREEFDIVAVHADPEADLQVYYDFTTGSGMSRKEAREAYLAFTSALRTHFPVFENTNMLYHELKSHYFLFLCRHGSWEALEEQVLSRPRAPASGLRDAPPRARAALRYRALAFDRASIDERIASIDSFMLRPRYQADLVEDDDRAHLDATLPPEAPDATVLVYDPATAEVRCLSPGAADLLRRCDGSRPAAEVVSGVPEEARAEALACLQDLLASGLIQCPRPVEAANA
jgi:anaerobic magnesium-protoporphyrin IX monomethyl ester cyclase